MMGNRGCGSSCLSFVATGVNSRMWPFSHDRWNKHDGGKISTNLQRQSCDRGRRVQELRMGMWEGQGTLSTDHIEMSFDYTTTTTTTPPGAYHGQSPERSDSATGSSSCCMSHLGSWRGLSSEQNMLLPENVFWHRCSIIYLGYGHSDRRP